MRWVAVFLGVLVLSCGLALAETGPRVIDSSGVIGHAGGVEAEIQGIYQEHQTIVSVEAVETLWGRDPDRLARDRFFELGLDREGLTVLNVLILYSRGDRSVRIAYASNCGHDKGRMDSIMRELTQELEAGEDRAFLNAVESLGDEIARRVGEGLTCLARTGNWKDMGLYTEGTVFLVSDEDWRDALRFVPVAVWNRNKEICQDIYSPGQGIESHKCGYPLLIYHREGEAFDADSIMLFLEQYQAERVLVVGNPPQDLVNLLGVAVENETDSLYLQDVKRLEQEDYKNFWRFSSQAVVVEGDYKTALMASAYASYLNAPLFVADRDFNPGDVVGKEVVCIGTVPGVDCKWRFNLGELQMEYIKVTGSGKAILVNPEDMGKEYCGDEGMDNVRELYCRDSLASAYLASAKDEVVMFSPGQGFEEIGPWFRKALEGLFPGRRGLEYLTTIAGHNAIDTGSAEAGGHSLERRLLDFNGDLAEDIPFGRIMGMTLSDTSSYIMRSVFYGKLYSNLYSSGPGLLAMGHSFEVGQAFLPEFIREVRQDYDADCYVQEDRYRGGVCNKGRPLLGEYQNRNIILFLDQGGVSQWQSVLNYNEVPDLDLSIGIAQASLTGSYTSAEYKHKLFSANFIRSGGIGYIGAISLASVNDVLSEEAIMGYIIVHYLVEEGESLGRVMEHAVDSMKREVNKKVYILFGDPSLNPGLPSTDIGYYPGGGA